MALAAVLLAAASVSSGATQGGNDMCEGRTAEAMATELMNRSSSPVLRVLVKLKADEQDLAALDHDTALLAAALRQDGALLAEPIGGQPLNCRRDQPRPTATSVAESAGGLHCRGRAKDNTVTSGKVIR